MGWKESEQSINSNDMNVGWECRRTLIVDLKMTATPPPLLDARGWGTAEKPDGQRGHRLSV